MHPRGARGGAIAVLLIITGVTYIALLKQPRTEESASLPDDFPDEAQALRLPSSVSGPDDGSNFTYALKRSQMQIVRCINSYSSNLAISNESISGICPQTRSPVGAGGVGKRSYMVYSYVDCLAPPVETHRLRSFKSHLMTVKSCLIFCDDAGRNYGSLLAGDTCLCQYKMGSREILVGGQCSIRCTGNRSEVCGGNRAVSVYHIRSPDGGNDWTEWMSPQLTRSGAGYSTRYRGCVLTGDERSCNATLEKIWDTSTKVPPAFERFIGCFAFGLAPREMKINSTGNFGSYSCISKCSDRGFLYAFVDFVKSNCACANSLGISRAFSTCDGLYGVGVYAAHGAVPNGGAVGLHFDGKPLQKKVHLLAYYRSGSTYVSELLNKHPGALYVYEPDASFGLTWNGDQQYLDYIHDEFYRAFELYLRCDVYRLPGRWIALNTFWPPAMELSYRFRKYYECTKLFGSDVCLSYFQAQCEAASIIAAKTIRISAGQQTVDFLRRNKGVIVMHLMRDPRGIMSSRKRLGWAVKFSQTRTLCSDLTRGRGLMGKMAKEGYRTYNIHYEDVAETPVAAAQYVYSNILNLNMTESVRQRLLLITGRSDKDDSKMHVNVPFAYSTHRENSLESLTKWKRVLTAPELETLERGCSKLV